MIEEQLNQILTGLQTDVQDALEKASKETAKEGVQKLKQNAPKRTGKYASGWGQSKRDDAIVIHNKKRPGLTHLLEKGHALRNGGRSKPIKHIKSVEEAVLKELENRIKNELSRIT